MMVQPGGRKRDRSLFASVLLLGAVACRPQETHVPVTTVTGDSSPASDIGGHDGIPGRGEPGADGHGDPAGPLRVVVAPGTKTFTANFRSTEMAQTGVYSWLASSVGRQSGTFTADFDVYADVMSDGDAGVVISNGTDPANNGYSWDDSAARVRFSSGKVQARNISDYCPGGPTPPCTAGDTAPSYVGLDQAAGGSAKLYHFRLVIDYPAQTYSSWVTNVTDAGTEKLIGLDYAFSSDWTEGPGHSNTATGLSAWSAWPDLSGTGATSSLRIANFAITP